MPKPYSQTRALWAITKASFKAIFNQPAAIFFSLLFPIIFILIFGAFGSGRGPSYRVALSPDSDTNNAFFKALKEHPLMRPVKYEDTTKLNKDLARGKLNAVLDIASTMDSGGRPHFIIGVHSTTANNNMIDGLMQTLDYLKLRFELAMADNKEEFVKISQPVITGVRQYRQIDFILPGQLGFSILFATLFGIAFTFYGLREQLVLKRFYASPVKKIHILLGIGMSRLFFQLLNVVVLILFGYFFLNFTLQNGLITFLEMLVLTVVMLFLLMAVGLIFSSIVKSDNSIPLWINLFGFPQMMLSGTFFPIEVFPTWLQGICRVLPLTQFNDAMRKLAFEGQHIFDCWKELGILGIWTVIFYIILLRVIKWQ